jgi:uncharacterized protein (TIGR00297 family)
VTEQRLGWQSKLVLLLVLPFAGTNLFFSCQSWFAFAPAFALWTLGISTLLGLITWRLRAATPFAALTGAVIIASLMFSTATPPWQPWRTAMVPTLAVSVLAFAATRIGRQKKERLGIAEARRGRKASQIAANLGFAALAVSGPAQWWLVDRPWFPSHPHATASFFAMTLAALAEAAADTVSSEIGQVFGGRPRMITTLRLAEPGSNGAISLAGTLAGILAAGFIALVGTWALRGDWLLFSLSALGAVFGLLFDSLLGATLEAWGWLNNDLVNFLSTASAAACAIILAALSH